MLVRYMLLSCVYLSVTLKCAIEMANLGSCKECHTTAQQLKFSDAR